MAAGAGAEGEDPFAEFLTQEQAVPTYAGHAQADPNMQLGMLLECAQRQEQLLGKVCSLLVGLDEKMGRLVSSQESLEGTMQQLASQGAGVAASSGGGAVAAGGPLGAGRPAVQRGSIVQPPGQRGAPPGPGQAASSAMSPEAQQAAAEKLAADKLRLEEEARRRAEELARKRAEEEERKRQEMERQRLEEERRREEERQRKEALEKKTNGLMSNLITSSGGGLFGDEDIVKRKSKGGLFDD